ncbi:hypothetical protein [Nocardia sp. NPDC020380]|uniref:hypothetical protein n=1 Tax=Nocardia sp. NPDC020380 TaxID=3364309 RepID=UPI0037B5DCC2
MSTPFDANATAATVADTLRDTDFAPLLASPVGDVLQHLGLPALPQLPPTPPLPELPPLPTLDLTALTKPLTDLAASFGTGTVGQDATNALQGVSTALQQVMSIASTFASLASQWQGSGSDSAAEKSTAAQSNAVELGAQNVGQKAVLGGAATTVGTGAALMSAIIAKFVTGVTVSAPFLVTPPGQAFLLSLASETAAEATSVVAKTRAELTVHSAKMTTVGQKVKVTAPPTGVAPSGGDSSSSLSQLLNFAQPLSSVASSGVQTAQQLQSISQPSEAPAQVPSVDPVAQPLNTGGGLPGGLAPMSAGPGAAPAPSQMANPRTMSATTTSPTSPEAAPSARSTAAGPGMVPPMGMAGGARAGDAGADEEVRTHMVTAEHGDEVVGELGNTGVAVVGAAGTTGPRTAQ